MKFKQPYFYQTSPDDPDVGGGSAGDQSVSEQTTETATVEATWPDNWRELAAGEDEKKLGILSRYQSPVAVADSLIAAQQKISSGEYKSAAPFPAEGTPEEQAAWREENGIPKTLEEYVIEAPEEDKGFVGEISKFAFENNIPKTHAEALYKFLSEQEQADIEAEKAADAQLQQTSEDQLRAEWGGDYRRNINIINGLFDSAGEGVKDAIFNARDSEGRPIGSNAAVLKFLADMALQINPVSALLPPGGGGQAAAVDDQLSEIEGWMKANDPKYWKDEKVQERYRQLLAYKQKAS